MSRKSDSELKIYCVYHSSVQIVISWSLIHDGSGVVSSCIEI